MEMQWKSVPMQWKYKTTWNQWKLMAINGNQRKYIWKPMKIQWIYNDQKWNYNGNEMKMNETHNWEYYENRSKYNENIMEINVSKMKVKSNAIKIQWKCTENVMEI